MKLFVLVLVVATISALSGIASWADKLVAASNCVPTDIVQAEARSLVLQAASTVVTKDVQINAELSRETLDSWVFRVFAVDATSPSNLIGWYSVDKRTGALVDTILGQPILIPTLVAEQTRQRRAHCSN